MVREKLKNILSFSGISLVFGIFGYLTAYLTILVTDWDLKINVKWLVLTIYVTVTIMLILIKLIIELNNELNVKPPHTNSIFRYVPENATFLIYKNDFLGHLAMVSIFYLDNSFEVELGKGYVKNIQDKFIQIQIIEISDRFSSNHSKILEEIEMNNVMALNKIVVKNYITFSN